MLFVRDAFPQETNVPSLYRALDWGSVVVFTKLTYVPTVVPRCAECLCPFQIPPATHCQLSWINTRLLPLGCSWHRVIIWTACRSLGSIRYYPHSFSLSFQLPLTLSSWPCSCFLGGIFPLFLSFSIWSECLNILPAWKMVCDVYLSPSEPLPRLKPSSHWQSKRCVCEYVWMLCTWSVHSIRHICAAAEHSSGQRLHCLVFNILYVCLCV